MDIIVCKPLDCTNNLSQMSLSYLQMIYCRLPAQWTCRVQDGRMICPYLQIMLLSTNLCKRPNLTMKRSRSLIAMFSCSFVSQICIFVSGSTVCRVFTLNTVTVVYMHAPLSPFVLQTCISSAAENSPHIYCIYTYALAYSAQMLKGNYLVFK